MTRIQTPFKPQDLDFILADAFNSGGVETAVAQFADGAVE